MMLGLKKIYDLRYDLLYHSSNNLSPIICLYFYYLLKFDFAFIHLNCRSHKKNLFQLQEDLNKFMGESRLTTQ